MFELRSKFLPLGIVQASLALLSLNRNFSGLVFWFFGVLVF